MKKTYLLAGLGAGLALTAASVAYAANGNYESWRTTMMGGRSGRAAAMVTAGNFDRFTEMHRLMADGKYDEAQKIRAELGMGQGRGKPGAGYGMHNGNRANFVDSNNNGICDHAEQLNK